MTETQKKQPTDKKQSKDELARYTFEFKGEKHDMAEGKSFKDVTKPGFQRRNRALSEDEVMWRILELLYTEDTLTETVDEMEPEEFEAFSEELGEALKAYAGASLGE